jgi:hypothetical protein
MLLLLMVYTGASAFSSAGYFRLQSSEAAVGPRRFAGRSPSVEPLRKQKSRWAARARLGGLRGASCLMDKEQSAIFEILRLAACTNRGQSATVDQKYEIENAISDLESSASIVSQMNIASDPALNGKWHLVYATERETRSSPFFWAFRKALQGVQQPFPVLPAELSESFFAITDGLPFYSVGRATQTISGVGSGNAQLVSSVQVKIRVFDALVQPLDGFVTTTSDYYAVGSKKAQLKVATTEVRDSTLQQLPFVGQLVQDVKFPTREALEQVREGSSEVEVEHTYLSDTLRVARNVNGQVFVYSKEATMSDAFGGFEDDFAADLNGPSSAASSAVASSVDALGSTTFFDADEKRGKDDPAWVEFTEFSEDPTPD